MSLKAQPVQSRERPWCDSIAWELVGLEPVALERFISVLVEKGASPDDVKQCARLLGLVVVGERIGHEMDFEETFLARGTCA